jgi:hypothetical protein
MADLLSLSGHESPTSGLGLSERFFERSAGSNLAQRRRLCSARQKRYRERVSQKRGNSLDCRPDTYWHLATKEQTMANEWGPLEALAGEWESEVGGLDTAFSHAEGKVLGTPYKEKLTLKPFGPVDNGSQHLYGLDYKSAMWRKSEDDPFHTEVGYWLWDAATGEILRGFVVPRGITVLAGGVASADAKEFTLKAAKGEKLYNIGENQYLDKNASSLSYEVTITIGDGTWSYEETTMLKMNEFDEPFAHTDRNTLRKVG